VGGPVDRLQGVAVDVDAVADRWVEFWELTKGVRRGVGPDQMLVEALAAFVNDEVGEDEGQTERSDLIRFAVAGVAQSGTHTSAALQQALGRLAS
jgi:hypothetical protein